MSKYNNPFDDLGKKPEWSDEDQKHFERLDYLIHRVFEQNEDGRELLEIWKEHLMMQPGCEPTDNDIMIGIREGTKGFIRNIILTIRKVNEDD